MYENGGNTTHRLLDGHPQLYVYPFESQIGTRMVNDVLTSMFPVKYRWPVFPLDGDSYGDYRAIIDEEGKVRSRTPYVSKFRDSPFDLDDEERLRIYQRIIAGTGRSRAANVAAFFQATFEAWKDYRRSGRETVYVGYSPIIVVDAEKIVTDMPDAHVLHVVRNPWSAYADTKKRPVPMALKDYALAWVINQEAALAAREKHPDRVHIVRTEDTFAGPERVLGEVLGRMGLEPSPTLAKPTWNGNELSQVYPWGTIRTPTPEANRATALELSPAERDEIRVRTRRYLDIFDYNSFVE